MKKYFFVFGSAALAAAVAVNINVSLNSVGHRIDVTLADVEVLANNEAPPPDKSTMTVTQNAISASGPFFTFSNTGNYPGSMNIVNNPSTWQYVPAGSYSWALRAEQGGYLSGLTANPSNPGVTNYAIYARLRPNTDQGAALYAAAPDTDTEGDDDIDGRFAGYFVGNVYMSGYVGIGNSYPSYSLDVSGNICHNGALLQSSDVRLKTNVKDLGSSLNQISKLRPVTYHLKPDDLSKYYSRLPDTVTISNDDELRAFFGLRKKRDETRKHIGFIAQELREIYPELVYEDDKGMLSVDYVSLIPVLVGTAQEQNETILEQNGFIAEMSRQAETIPLLHETIREMLIRVESVQTVNEMLMKRLEALEKNAGGALQCAAVANNVSLSLFPNPTSGFTTVEYTLHVDAPICIELYSMFGQRVKLITPKQNQMAGTYSAQTSVVDLNSGTYIVRATSGSEVVSEHLIVKH